MALLNACVLLAVATHSIHADEVTLRFDIKGGPLAEALMAFGAQSGAIVFAPTDLTTGKRSEPVSGTLAIAEALKRLLKGSGLHYVIDADGTIVIAREPVGGV